jgi:puromycin-sensitive aminopeptidase
MTTHAYGNTETTDLWDAIEAASGEPVRRIMDSWIFQGGHPVVTVQSRADDRVLHLEQERFRYLPDPDDKARWVVPMQLRYGTAGGEVVTTTALLDGDEMEIDLPEPVTWVVANAEGHGFYRVQTSAPLREALVALLPSADGPGQLSDVERYGLADDTWAAVLAGTTSAEEFITLAEGYAHEHDVSVWRRLLGGLAEIERVLDPADSPALEARIRALVGPALDRLGWDPRDGESDRDRELRGALIGALVTLGEDRDAETRVRELFAAYRKDNTAVEANVAGAVVRAVAAGAGPAEVDAIIEGFRTATTPQEEQRYLFALAEVRDPELFARVLELAASSDVRTQNAPYLLGVCIANRDNGAAAWRLVSERWDELVERFPSNSIVRMLNGIRSISDPDLAREVEAFLEEHPVPQGAKILAQHLERMRVTVALRERVLAGVRSG